MANEAQLLIDFQVATNDLKEAAQALQKMTAKTKEAENAAKKSSKAAVDWGKRLQTVGKGFAAVGKAVGVAALGIASAATATGAFAFKLAEVDKQLKQAQRPFDKFGDAGKLAFSKINEYANKAGVNLEEARAAGAKFANAGFSANKAQELVKIQADIAAGSGKNFEDLNAFGDKLVEIAAKGKTEWSDLEALMKETGNSEAIKEVLRGRTGAKNDDQLEKQFKADKVALDDVVKSIIAVTRAGRTGDMSLGGLAKDKAAESASAQIERLMGIWKEAQEKFSQALFTPENVKVIGELADNFGKFIKSDGFQAGVTLFSDAAMKLAGVITTYLEYVNGGPDRDKQAAVEAGQREWERKSPEQARKIDQSNASKAAADANLPYSPLLRDLLSAIGVVDRSKNAPTSVTINQTNNGVPNAEKSADMVSQATKRGVEQAHRAGKS